MYYIGKDLPSHYTLFFVSLCTLFFKPLVSITCQPGKAEEGRNAIEKEKE